MYDKSHYKKKKNSQFPSFTSDQLNLNLSGMDLGIHHFQTHLIIFLFVPYVPITTHPQPPKGIGL